MSASTAPTCAWTGARGGSRAAVEELRDQLAAARVELLAALADVYFGAGQPERAVPALEEALRLRPDRDDLAQRLAVVLRAAGRQAAATRMIEEYDIASQP
jgi:cytochrome c-type biogenesis protein CcmH/NrfG